MSWEPTYISNNVTYDDNDPDKKDRRKNVQ